MIAQLVSSEITEYHINFKINNKDVIIVLTKGRLCTWEFSVYKKKWKLTVEELIEVCNLIYSREIINEDDCIAIRFNDTEPTYIRGKNQITSEILKGISVSILDNT